MFIRGGWPGGFVTPAPARVFALVSLVRTFVRMLNSFIRPMSRAVMRAAGLATAAVLVLTVTASASSPAAVRGSAQAAGPAATAGVPVLPLFGRKADGHLYDYEPLGTGGVRQAVDLGGGFADATAMVQNEISDNGAGVDLYYRMGGTLYYTAERGAETKVIGGGWDMYNLLVTAGKLGGGPYPGLLARDTAGVLWLYPGQANGVLGGRVRAGTGFDSMDRIVSRGDFTGDGKIDLIVRTTGGTLYLYPGTGTGVVDAMVQLPRIVAGTGWNIYNAVVSTGDNDGDGKADLIASDTAGALWLFKGTGVAATPFATRVQIGTGGWQAFNTLF
ncbi:FG-GAP-like repeat-containing protein [Streptomyces sp. SPB162]|uniref:FG-GAP-like repeat-containing protein n=1 Tax=Streptomyces sp. SPB162 TaxID=2940560 RepID=UPI0024073185|nr:FG-GAP-like repeat-containing protein [Streptomyces sp. SPB162]MDF9815747.1 hypothetical protein [Streptomyces sp. SPB162]